jgi:hypothetical protein
MFFPPINCPGAFKRGAAPLFISSPLEQILIRAYGIKLFERGIKGVSISTQTDTNNTFCFLNLPAPRHSFIIRMNPWY